MMPLPLESIVDVKVRFCTVPPAFRTFEEHQTVWYVSPFIDDRGCPFLTVYLLSNGLYYRFSYSDGAEYVIENAGAEVWAFSSGEATRDDLISYLLGPIIGFVLRLKGFACLHASSIAFNGHAILFAGPEYAGKSTTAMAFARQGYTVLSDNNVPIIETSDAILAQPACPVMRLRAHSIDVLDSMKTRFSPIPRPPEEQRLHFDLRGNGYGFQAEPLELGTIYLLGDRTRFDSPPLVEGVSMRTALVELLANAFASRWMDRDLRRKEFNTLSRIARAIRLRRLCPSSDPARLPELCELILQDASMGCG